MSGVDQRLGSRYVLKERLGRGAMGTVWRALNTDTGQDVAVKVLSEELSDEPEMVTRFIQERNTLITVTHPNLVRIHDLVVEDGKLGIVMDLVPGPDLHKHLTERGVLSLAEAAVIGRGVSDALVAIHAAGIIHRDLKPANILLDLSGPEPQPKLVDFGIARMLAGSRLTARSSVVGTPQYLSPEAISGQEPTPAVDVYAFGIALYELFTGAPPFSGDQLLQVLNQHMYQEPPWPTSIPAQILPLLQAMLAKNPEARPTALDISHTMDELLRSAPQAAAQAWRPGPTAPVPLAPSSPVPGGYAPPQSPAPQSPIPQSPLPQGQAPYGRQAPPANMPQSPYAPQQQPYPQAPGTPLPGGYGTPGQSPLPAPSPSGFFYPGREMFGDPEAPAPAPTPAPAEDAFSGGGQVFSTNPPPFTEAMFAAKKPARSWRKPLLIGGPAVAVLAVVGVVLALTMGGNGGKPQPGPTGTQTGTGPTAAVALPNCPAEPAVNVPASARWTLAGNGADCSVAPAATNSLKLAHGADFTESVSRGKTLRLATGNAVATVANSGFVNTANSFTVSIWVDLDSLDKTKFSTVLAMQGNSIDAFRLEYNPGWGGWAFNRSSTDSPKATWVAAGSKTAPKVQRWTHLVGVYDASAKTMTLYVDGKQVAQSTNVVAWNAGTQIALGADIYQNGTAYNGMLGKLSDLQIFDSALNPQQIASLS